ncbi:YegP family protein [Hyunsoonleella pacifica]|uniref:DUF1508 domain-containing protein n=1 Tax=Hyunsoonleella pacifica TaxID=1080224 RepID=A0A4Q9FQZ0_9FLAO|nr:hypothetical protein [Hyunsoonleella pacifica]TBN15679.1 hypothetical protein EYD46_11185 [Hyunsoonleella pacifica]GGD21760.1 hypothetical protein GCM10011368_24750 [Hyunsoonleella pacifica]
MTLIKLYKDKFEKYSFFVKVNHQIIFFSRPYASKYKCIEKINFYRAHCRLDKNYKRLKADCGSYYFVYCNHLNGEEIGMSESYLDANTMEHSITQMRMIKINMDTQVYAI